MRIIINLQLTIIQIILYDISISIVKSYDAHSRLKTANFNHPNSLLFIFPISSTFRWHEWNINSRWDIVLWEKTRICADFLCVPSMELHLCRMIDPVSPSKFSMNRNLVTHQRWSLPFHMEHWWSQANHSIRGTTVNIAVMHSVFSSVYFHHNNEIFLYFCYSHLWITFDPHDNYWLSMYFGLKLCDPLLISYLENEKKTELTFLQSLFWFVCYRWYYYHHN